MKRLFPALIGLVSALIPLPAAALSIPQNFCGLGGFFCGNVVGLTGLSIYVENVFIYGIGTTFVAIATGMFFYYATSLITGSNEESTVTESKTAYAHAITGGAIVSLAGAFVTAFSPGAGGPAGALVNQAPIDAGFGNAITYFRLILGVALIVNTVVQGIRLIMAQGDEGIGAARKRLLYGFVGVAIVLLANAIVSAVYGGGSNTNAITSEIVGLANFLITIFGALCVMAIVAAGLLLIVSVDESLKDKAKNIVKTSIIALAIVLCSYVIVNAFIILS